jgi:hypothetical protein
MLQRDDVNVFRFVGRHVTGEPGVARAVAGLGRAGLARNRDVFHEKRDRHVASIGFLRGFRCLAPSQSPFSTGRSGQVSNSSLELPECCALRFFRVRAQAVCSHPECDVFLYRRCRSPKNIGMMD